MQYRTHQRLSIVSLDPAASDGYHVDKKRRGRRPDVERARMDEGEAGIESGEER